MPVMEAIGVLPDAGREPRLSNALSFVPFRLAKPCSNAGCGEHGVCDELNGRCLCQLGWGGDSCQEELFPACRLTEMKQPSPAISVPCASLRRLAPVACECIAQCLAAGHEVCGPLSFGCQRAWRSRRRRPREPSEPDLTTRGGFHASMQCLSHPRNVSIHSGLPAHPAAKLVSFAHFSHQGHDEGAPPAPHSLTVYGAGVVGRESRPAGAEWVDTLNCPASCSGRGRCLRIPATKSRGRRLGRRQRRRAARGGDAVEANCVCADGSFGPGCENVCSNDCFNDCSGNPTSRYPIPPNQARLQYNQAVKSHPP